MNAPAASRHAPVPLVHHLADLIADYDGILSDVWGVVHNGERASPEACAALAKARESGAKVVLISNAPRPAASVRAQLDSLGAPREAYDDIVTSGDVTRAALEERPGLKVFHLGPARDRGVFEGLNVEMADEAAAEIVVNSGLHDDETEAPEDYRGLLGRLAERGLPMICANPDIVVERGDRLVWCAGALAEIYEEIGGDVVLAGKPHAPIYERALRRLDALAGRAIPRERVLAIGDSLRTDLAGAARMGLDALFVAEGIHGEEAGRGEAFDPEVLDKMFVEAGVTARAVMLRLAW